MQFHIVNWGPDGRCSNLKTVTDVIEEVSKVQRRTGNNPIVVHCRWGIDKQRQVCVYQAVRGYAVFHTAQQFA